MADDSNQLLRIKCSIQSPQNPSLTVRRTVIESVSSKALIDNVQFRLAQLCGSPVRVYYKDKFSKQLFIRGQSDLDQAISSCSGNELELILVPISAPNGNNNNKVDIPNSNIMEEFSQILPAEMLKTLWTSFSKKAKDGWISKQSFMDIMKEQLAINDYAEIEQLFNAFDYHKNGLLDFRQIITGFAVLHQGSPDEKIKLAFKSFDVDGNGKLVPAELFMMFKSIATTKGIRHQTKDIDLWVKDCFAKYDRASKGYLDFKEFKQMVHRRPLLIQAFFQFNK